MSSERRLLGTITITPISKEISVNPAKKSGLIDLFKKPFVARKTTPTAPIDLNTIITEVIAEQKLDQSVTIVPNAPEIEFRLLAQRIKAASKEDRIQIMKTVNIFHEVNQKAEEEGKSKLSLIDIPKGVKAGKVAEVEDIAAERIPFSQMPGSQGLRQSDTAFMAYQRVEGNPLDQLKLNGPAEAENNAQLAILLPRTEVAVIANKTEQQGMTAVIMLDDDEKQIEQATSAENTQLSGGNISYLSDYRKADGKPEVSEENLAA